MSTTTTTTATTETRRNGEEARAQPSGEPGKCDEMIEIAGIIDWHRPGGMACGAATSLYERHPVTSETAGNPLADVRSP